MPIGWIKIEDCTPPRYTNIIKRNGLIFTACPCYGMHHPWWVVRHLDGSEGPPVNMEDSDEWLSVSENYPGESEEYRTVPWDELCLAVSVEQEALAGQKVTG